MKLGGVGTGWGSRGASDTVEEIGSDGGDTRDEEWIHACTRSRSDAKAQRLAVDEQSLGDLGLKIIVEDSGEGGVGDLVPFGDEEHSRRAVDPFGEEHAWFEFIDRHLVDLAGQIMGLSGFVKEANRVWVESGAGLFGDQLEGIGFW